MPKTPREFENEFLDGLQSKTGRSLNQWLEIIKKSRIEKRNDILKWLKTEHEFNHLQANMLTSISFNNGKPVYGNEDDLLDKQFEKYPEMRPLYEELLKVISEWDKTVSFIVKKTYISIARKREFAAINIRKGELRLGLDLGEMPFKGRIEQSKLTGPMTRISHMIIIKNSTDIDQEMMDLLKLADNRVQS